MTKGEWKFAAWYALALLAYAIVLTAFPPKSYGQSYNSQTYDDTTYYNDNKGNNCTTSRYGDQSYTNCY